MWVGGGNAGRICWNLDILIGKVGYIPVHNHQKNKTTQPPPTPHCYLGGFGFFFWWG